MKKSTILIFISSIFLMACASNKIKKIEVITLAKTTKSWNGSPLPKYHDGTPEVTILQITIPPKTILEMHKHPEINAGIILKGQLMVISETNDTLHLRTGQSIVELVNIWHYGINESKKPVELIVFYAGIEGTPNTVKKE